eukprot:snap_masked-scaffold323_size206388-processed-gene-1.3 protein:Tk12476 transcript:snap_masked-scaffold323_size206388-processed-gene-1.3-mRNA-1 annotation:"major facilitator superfamily domain-containing protein 10"
MAQLGRQRSGPTAWLDPLRRVTAGGALASRPAGSSTPVTLSGHLWQVRFLPHRLHTYILGQTRVPLSDALARVSSIQDQWREHRSSSQEWVSPPSTLERIHRLRGQEPRARMTVLRSGTVLDDPDGTPGEGVTSVTTSSCSPPPATSRMTRVIFVGLLLDLLAFTLILPLFPALLDYYRRHDRGGLYTRLEAQIRIFQTFLGAPEQFNSVLFGGFLGSLFSLLQFLASPILGGLSDLYGRRPLLLLSTAGVAVSYGVWATASTFSLFVLARVIGGLAKGNVSLATAIVTDESGPRTRGRGMALIGIAFSIGFILGPIIGAAFSIWAKERTGQWYVYPALCALALSLLDWLFLYLKFEETLPEKRRLKHFGQAVRQAFMYINPVSLFRFESLRNLPPKQHEALQTLGLVYFLYLFLYSGLEFTLTFLCHIRFQFTSMQQGQMFLFIGLLMACVQGGYVRKIPPGREKTMVLYGLLTIIPSFAIVGFAYNLPTLYLGLALYALSTAVCVPCMTTLVSNYGDASQKGIVMGVYRSLGALGRALGPVVSCTCFWLLGPEVCYCVGGLALIIPYLLLKRSAA